MLGSVAAAVRRPIPRRPSPKPKRATNPRRDRGPRRPHALPRAAPASAAARGAKSPAARSGSPANGAVSGSSRVRRCGRHEDCGRWLSRHRGRRMRWRGKAHEVRRTRARTASDFRGLAPPPCGGREPHGGRRHESCCLPVSDRGGRWRRGADRALGRKDEDDVGRAEGVEVGSPKAGAGGLLRRPSRVRSEAG